MPSVSLDSGAELFYEDDWLGAPWLKPEPALLIHGAGESSRAWFGWVPRMAQQFRLLRPDLPGFGRSTVPNGFEWSVANLAAVIAQFLDKVGIESAHIVGAKLGGAIAIVDKRRSSATETRQVNLIGSSLEGKVAVIFDDMITTAGSVVGAGTTGAQGRSSIRSSST